MVVSSPSTQLNAQDSESLKQVWETIDADSCPYTYNFHMHTICSDGQLTPLSLMQQAIHIGLKGMAITDHHSVRGYFAAQDWLVQMLQKSEQNCLPHLWTGVEITASLDGVEVHILGYAFAPESLAIRPYLQEKSPQGKKAAAKQVIASIHQAGGLAVLAHPARYRRPAHELIPLAANLGIDGVEAYYAYTNPKPWQTSPVQTKQVKELAREYNLFTTCGTDTHGLDLLRRI
jgi:predicted metal-dependent phosphoesterase TrpH